MVKPKNKTIRSKKRRTEARAEARILAAARQVFVERGLAGARMQTIADLAGVNKALLHYYFRSKKRLYEAVLENILTTIGSALRHQLTKESKVDDTRKLLRQIISAYINTLRTNPDFPMFIMRELADGGAHLPKIADAFISGFGDVPLKVYRLLLKESLNEGIRNVVPVHIALNIVGMCIFTFIARPVLAVIQERTPLNVKYDDRFFDDRINAIVAMACDGLFKERRA